MKNVLKNNGNKREENNCKFREYCFKVPNLQILICVYILAKFYTFDQTTYSNRS